MRIGGAKHHRANQPWPAVIGMSFMKLLIWVLLAGNIEVFCFAVRSSLPQRTATATKPKKNPLQPPMAIHQLRLHSTDHKKNSRRNSISALQSTDEDNQESHNKDEETKMPYTGVLRGGGQEVSKVGLWPCFDALDKQLIKVALPCIANFAINPLIGAVDLFWINRMGNALAVAGQAAANQVFSSTFWLVSFLPQVTAPLVSIQHAKGDQDALQDAVCQALMVAFWMAVIGTPLLFFLPKTVLSAVLQDGSPAHAYATPYLLIRAFALLPSLISVVGFSAFRGVLDTVTPMKISAFANLFNAILDPILIFTLGMGVPGAALATLVAEIISAGLFLYVMFRKNMIRWSKLFKIPRWMTLKPLLRGGAALQLRNLALNVTFLAVTRVTQSIDKTGVAAAAHAMAIQVFQLGGIVLLALSTVAQTVVPNEMVEKRDPETRKRVGGPRAAKAIVNRLMSWGFVLGTLLGGLQLLVLPYLHKSSPLLEVRQAARVPSYLGSVYQIINGMVFIGEGVMVGCGSFLQLSLGTALATLATLQGLKKFPPKYGLTGVWMGFGIFNVMRLLAVWYHQTQNGPLSPSKLKQKTAEE